MNEYPFLLIGNSTNKRENWLIDHVLAVVLVYEKESNGDKYSYSIKKRLTN